jgi:two-component system nitrate/nitrite response regulator NarL
VVITAEKLHLYDLRIGLRFGVAGYLLYSLPPDAFGLSLRLVLAGERVYPPELASLLVSGKGSRVASERGSAANGAVDRKNGDAVLPALLGYPNLNPLDVQILNLLVGGITNKQIALALDLSEEMVKLQLMQIMRKIKVKNRTQAALWTVQSGIYCDSGNIAMGLEAELYPILRTA